MISFLIFSTARCSKDTAVVTPGCAMCISPDFNGSCALIAANQSCSPKTLALPDFSSIRWSASDIRSALESYVTYGSVFTCFPYRTRSTSRSDSLRCSSRLMMLPICMSLFSIVHVLLSFTTLVLSCKTVWMIESSLCPKRIASPFCCCLCDETRYLKCSSCHYI